MFQKLVLSKKLEKIASSLLNRSVLLRGRCLTKIAQKAVLIQEGLAISEVFGYNFEVLNCKDSTESERSFKIEANKIQSTTRTGT